MMIRSRMPSCSAGGMAGWAGSVKTAGPGVGWFVTGGTTDRVGPTFPEHPVAAGPQPVAAGPQPVAAGPQPAAVTETSVMSAEKPPSAGTRPVSQTSTYRVVTGVVNARSSRPVSGPLAETVKASRPAVGPPPVRISTVAPGVDVCTVIPASGWSAPRSSSTPTPGLRLPNAADPR